ncbi:MAG TPA: [FeFe] hydrogenase H-cluster radical SAM maturase HydE [Candidatus Pullilachnospira intestinigallinarum]|nr:[FeFe] hydrogenase H-cluster radical SAM maturase HydE [Candidatus Pullilachnospira intestinigallinarum]
MSRFEKLLDRLGRERRLATEEYEELVRTLSREEAAGEREELFARAGRVREAVYGKKVYIRGLVEVSNVCRNDCYYCGIRKSNGHAVRYRMDQEEILECCREGYRLGFRTFVFQGGEDPAMTDEVVEALVAAVHREFPDCAITLSLGEKERESYQRFFDAGASRYLLRHETASPEHYRRLHPPSMSWEHRVQCLRDLKEIGYQVGCGCMIGSPFQTAEHLAEDLKFMERLQPEMVGIGPFISQKDTPFRDFPGGGLTQTLVMLGLIRLLLPRVLLPATTALGTIDPEGRQKGILAGANVVMPNLSPPVRRKQYMLYDNKLGTGEESAEGLALLKAQMQSIGYQVVTDRGDYPGT